MSEKRTFQPLTVELDKSQLVIRIGFNTLATAFEYSLNNLEATRPMFVKQALIFAHDVREALEKEEEDGYSIIEKALDLAFTKAIKNGTTGVGFKWQ